MGRHDARRAMRLLRAYLATLGRLIPYEHGHAQRVTAISEEIAERIGFTQPGQRVVRLAGLLHDIGKLYVPPEVLQKRGILEPDEYAMVQRHPAYGAAMLRAYPALAPAIPGVLHHHERWDGSGYPAHLVGRTIPLVARILAVADVFDALTSDRVYRPALPVGEAKRIVARDAGVGFDPAIVRLLLIGLESPRRKVDTLH